MSNFVKIRKHEITSAYLHLDSRRYTDLVINQAEIASAGFDLEYPNGFGEVLPHLTLMLTSGDKIELYREDAKAAWEKLNEDEDEKLLKTIKDYAAHEHKDATPLDVALCIEQAIDNKEKNVKYKKMCEDIKADMCGTDNEVLCDYLDRLLRKYGEIV